MSRSPDSFTQKLRDRVRFPLFLIAGGAASGVNIASRIVLNLIMPYEVAILVA
jgi:putative flippase GtrA